MGIVKDILYRVANKNFLNLFKKQSIYPYYHIVKNEKVAHIENLYQYKNETQFRFDLDILSKKYNSINLNNLLLNKKTANKFLISFDDGLEEIYSVIYPILKEKKINAIFFINPDFVDNNIGLYKHYISVIISYLKNSNIDEETYHRLAKVTSIIFTTKANFFKDLKETKYSEKAKINEILNILNINIKDYLQNNKPYISKMQIQEMINDGFYFGGHTMSHPPLHQISYDEQKKEIINSINWLKSNFGINYSIFAFPFSDKSVSKKLLNELFEYDSNILLFGNSGLKKDIDNRIIQRFSLENPIKQIEKQIVTENLYMYFNKVIGKYHIKRL